MNNVLRCSWPGWDSSAWTHTTAAAPSPPQKAAARSGAERPGHAAAHSARVGQSRKAS
ncbi:hypothetical protein ACFRU3_19435 [Streptomyces sp. NPDC056910]|uniref:hypothetical protein n=1 Tax=Streptomyces sp. NPDC056910 TaxID=3345964 RepID=UPI0036CBFAE3